MPTEIRKIAFDVDEVRRAAVDFCLRNNIAMPRANIREVRVDGKGEAPVAIHFTPANPAHPDTVRLSRDQVAAALIRFCMDAHIPLPRHAQKVLQVQESDQTVTLMMKVALAAGTAA